MTTKHTPGPWTWTRSRRGFQAKISGPSGVWDTFAKVVIRMEYADSDHPEGSANAQLIVAAPALADALETLLRVYEYTDNDAQAQAVDAGSAALRLAGRLP